LYAFHNTTEQFGMEISPVKSNVMAFKGQVPIRSKVVLGDTILKQVNASSYLGCIILFEEQKDITSKISICL
jgi:hypothetical protein